MISGELIGGDDVKRYVDALAPRLQGALDASIGRLTLRLLRAVKADKLSGQVLNVRTGRLRRSINARFEAKGTPASSGIVGTNLSYAAAHEFGFKSTVSVRQSLRIVKQAFGRPITPVQASVRAHTRKVNLPERSFLRSALTEMQDEISAELKGAVTKVIKP